MSDETCDICKRPKWDGGHAINARECTRPGDDACQLATLRATHQRAVELLERYKRESYIRGLHEATVEYLVAPWSSTPAPPPSQGEGEATRCKSWCGTTASGLAPEHGLDGWVGYGCEFCTSACRDAGRPLNPVPSDTAGEVRNKG